MVQNIAPAGASPIASGAFTELGGPPVLPAPHGVRSATSSGAPTGRCTDLVQDINPTGSSDPGGFTELGGFLYFRRGQRHHRQRALAYERHLDHAGPGHQADVRLARRKSSPGSAISCISRPSTAPTAGSSFARTAPRPRWSRTSTSDRTTRVRPSSPARRFPLLPRQPTPPAASSCGAPTGLRPRGVADIVPGPHGSDIDELATLGGTLYFTADDGVSGRELWADGRHDDVDGQGHPPGSTGSAPFELTHVR